MPPPRSLIAAKSRDFICQPCLAKLRLRKHPTWTVRTIKTKAHNRHVASKTDETTSELPHRQTTVKYYTADRDGTLEEVREQNDSSRAGQDLEARIATLESQLQLLQAGGLPFSDEILDNDLSSEKSEKLKQILSRRETSGMASL